MQLSTGISAYLAKPASTPLGAVVVIQEIFGVNAHIRDLVDRFAAEGYVTIAPALFDPVRQGVELDYDTAGFDEGRALITELGLERPLTDVRAAADAVSGYGKVGTVGYCWGGTLALLAALRFGLPSVSFYGARNVPFLKEPLLAPVQFHFGADDKGIPAEMVAAHRAALPDMDVFVYEGAGHGFHCDRRASFHAPSAALGWQRTLDFLRAQLGAA